MAALVAGLVAWSTPARADTLVINRPGYHPRYTFEAEPHALVGFIDPPGFGHGNGFGVGFRGTVKIVDNGFVPKINNSVGIGFGADFVYYGSRRCIDLNAQGACVRSDAVTYVWFPVVLQWNFFLSRNWSVFGEPGVAVRYESWSGPGSGMYFDYFQFYLGGRYHFSDNVTLTMRVGYPTFSVGVSFLI